MGPIIQLLITIIDLYDWVLMCWIIVSLLTHFSIINTYHPVVRKVSDVLGTLIDPVLNAIRRYIPLVSGLDLSPIVLMILLQFIKSMLLQFLYTH